MKALQVKRNNLHSIWRSLVVLSIAALAFTIGACSGDDDDNNNKATTITIDNTPKRIRSMAVTKAPANYSYQGCPPDLTGMEVRVEYIDGTSATLGPDMFYTKPEVCENAADGNIPFATSADFLARTFDLYYHGSGAIISKVTVPKIYPLASVSILEPVITLYEDDLQVGFGAIRLIGNYWNSIDYPPNSTTVLDPASSNSGTVLRLEKEIPIRTDLTDMYIIGGPGLGNAYGVTFDTGTDGQRVIRYKIADNDMNSPFSVKSAAPGAPLTYPMTAYQPNQNNINTIGSAPERPQSPFVADISYSRLYEVDRIEYVAESANFDPPLFADEFFLDYVNPNTGIVTTAAEAWMNRLQAAGVKFKVYYKYLDQAAGYITAPEATKEIGMKEYIYAWKRLNAADPVIAISPDPPASVQSLVDTAPYSVLFLAENYDLNLRLQYFSSNIKGITTTPIAQATYPNAAIIPLTDAGMIYQFNRFEAERRNDTLAASNHQAQTFGLSFDDSGTPAIGNGMDRSTSGTLYDLSMALWTYWRINAVYTGLGGELKKEISRDAFLDAGMYGNQPYNAAGTAFGYTHHINSAAAGGVPNVPWNSMSPASQGKLRQLVPGDGETENDDLEMNIILPMSQQRNYLPIDIFGVNFTQSATTPYYIWPGWAPNGTWQGGSDPQHPIALTGVSPLYSRRSVGPASIGGSYQVNADMLGRGPLSFTGGVLNYVAGEPDTSFPLDSLSRDSVDLPFQKLP